MSSQRPISIRFPDHLLAEIDKRDHNRGDDRGGRSVVVREAVDRYVEICERHSPARLKPDGTPHYTQAELNLICDALNGVWLASGADSRLPIGQTIAIEVSDACELNGLHTKHDVPHWKELVARIAESSYADKIALVDFVEHFWADG